MKIRSAIMVGASTALFAATLATAVHAGSVTESLDVGEFHGIALQGASSLVLKQGDTVQVSVEVERDDLPRVSAETRDGVLNLELKSKGWFGNSGEAHFVVVAPQVRRLTLAGSGDIEAEQLAGDAIKIELLGSGDLQIDELLGKAMNLELAGSGDINIDDATLVDASVSIMGSGDVGMAGAVARLDVSIMGSGDVIGPKLVTDKITGAIMGSGDITVGRTASHRVKTFGSGEVLVLGE